MGRFRAQLPQLGGDLFFAGGGGEWEDLRTIEGRWAMRERVLGLAELARTLGAGLVIDAPVFQCRSLPIAADEAEAADRRALAFAVEMRDEASLAQPVVLNARLGCRPDIGGEVKRLFAAQLRWLASSEIDLVSSPVFHDAERAIAFVEEVGGAGLPTVVTLAGENLRDMIEVIDAATDAKTAWFSIDCADPTELLAGLDGQGWTRRIRGIEVSPMLSLSPTSEALRGAYRELAERAPWIAIAGGGNVRQIAAMARAFRELGEVRPVALSG